MDRRGKITLVLMGITILALGIYIFGRGGGTTEEDRIRAVLNDVARAAEERDAWDFVAPLTDDFVLKPDELDKGKLRFILSRAFLGLKKDPAVVFRNVEIDIPEDGRAIATLQAASAEAGAIAAGVRPDRAWDIRCHFVKVDGEWMIEQAEANETNW